MSNKYIIIAIMGKAGSGKDTLVENVCKDVPTLHKIISCTTRPPRQGEQDGVNYHFISGEEFGARVLDGRMFEATYFNEWFYGTSTDSLRKDKINIGVFNPEGVETLLHCSNVKVIPIYLVASDKNRLIRQLQREDDPDVYEVIRRFKADNEDFDGIEFEPWLFTIYDNNTEEELEENTKNLMYIVNEIYRDL